MSEALTLKTVPKSPPGDATRVIQVRAPATRARVRRRHWGLLTSFLLLVVAPLFVIAIYLTEFAVPQYASTSGFTVRQNEASQASDGGGGARQIAGSATVDGDILYEFIESQTLVQRLQDRLDLVGHYSQYHGRDPVFSLSPDATIEGSTRHWRRVVRTSYNQANGLIEVRVLAFTPEIAEALSQAIIEEGQALVNALNATAREDAMRYAQSDLDVTSERLRDARDALTQFRSRTQIVNPQNDLQRRLGVLNNLQQQLAEMMIEYDMLSDTTAIINDPRLRQVSQRIDVIRARILEEREVFNTFDYGEETGGYPSLMTEYEGLVVERGLAEESYGVALAALDLARTNAARESRYLAVYLPPSQPEAAAFPQVGMTIMQAALFLLVGWAIIVLIVYSLRDRQ